MMLVWSILRTLGSLSWSEDICFGFCFDNDLKRSILIQAVQTDYPLFDIYMIQ